VRNLDPIPPTASWTLDPLDVVPDLRPTVEIAEASIH
jgi:hypothetical protein